MCSQAFFYFPQPFIHWRKVQGYSFKKPNWILGSDYGAETEPHSSLGVPINAQISPKCCFKMHFLGVGTLVLALRD